MPHPLPQPLASILACPACGVVLEREDSAYRCGGCATRYPDVGGVPWLLPQPERALHEWRLRVARLIGQLETDAAQIETELADTSLSATSRSRVKLMAGARRDHARRLAALLAPLESTRVQISEALHEAFGTPLPASQDLASYYVNAHRDWAWGEEENVLGRDLVVEVLAEHRPCRILVLGAGAGRLAYDLHQQLAAELTVAADLNPLFVLLADRMFRGESCALYEFPIAPRSIESHAILRRLAAPAPSRPGLAAAFVDASAPAFAPGSFDTVVTPWLIDILDEDLTAFLPRVNALLSPGGRWVNMGSLVFGQRAAARRYSLEEVLELAAGAGFETSALTEREMPYLRSPASRHARFESIVRFAAIKVKATPATAAATRDPPWLRDDRMPIALDRSIELAALSTRVHAFVLSLIDGRRSVADIVDLLVAQRLMTREDATASIRSFLGRLHAEEDRPRWQ